MEENNKIEEAVDKTEKKQTEETPQPKQEKVIEAEPVTKTDNSAQETTTPEDIEKNKGMAILAYILFFIPLLTEAKDSKFAMFHANQSLMLVLANVGLFVLGSILTVVTLGFGGILVFAAWIAWIVFWVMGIINAANGKMKELPLIGGIHILDKK